MTQSIAEHVDAEIGTRGLIIGNGTARKAFNEFGHVVELPENRRIAGRLNFGVRTRVTRSAKAEIVDEGCGCPEKTAYRDDERFRHGRVLCPWSPERVMLRILPPCFAALVACTPSSEEATMRKPSLVPVTAARESSEIPIEGQGAIPEPLSAADNSAPAGRADSPAEAEGRRTLSTAFVRVGPGGHLTVELRDGRAIVLRDVVMRPRDYCGVQVLDGSAGTRYCGGYGDVAAARPGAAPALDEPGPAVLNPVKAARSPSERD